MYTDSDYNCPYCGWIMDYSNLNLGRDGYGFICPDCGKYFETPDV